MLWQCLPRLSRVGSHNNETAGCVTSTPAVAETGLRRAHGLIRVAAAPHQPAPEPV
jgi:hypothetical protein